MITGRHWFHERTQGQLHSLLTTTTLYSFFIFALCYSWPAYKHCNTYSTHVWDRLYTGANQFLLVCVCVCVCWHFPLRFKYKNNLSVCWMYCTVRVCVSGCFIYFSLFGHAVLWETQSKFYCKPKVTEGLQEPKPSIRGGHISRMQTNELEHSPPIGPTAQRSKIGSKDVREGEGMPYNYKMKIRKPSSGTKGKARTNVRIHGE